VRNFLAEVRRRNVFRVALVYVIAGWLTMQVVDVMFPALKLPEWLTSAVAAFLIIGFPFAVIFAWAFELTPDGIKRERDVDRSESVAPQTGQKLNHAALIILTVAVGFLMFDKFVLHGDPVPADEPAAAAAETRPSIAVLPFVNMSDDRENEYFSDGLSEELLNLLARIPQLHVAGRLNSREPTKTCASSARRSTSGTCSRAVCASRAHASGSQRSSSTPIMAITCGRTPTIGT
jgi:hypothetical protein